MGSGKVGVHASVVPPKWLEGLGSDQQESDQIVLSAADVSGYQSNQHDWFLIIIIVVLLAHVLVTSIYRTVKLEFKILPFLTIQFSYIWMDSVVSMYQFYLFNTVHSNTLGPSHNPEFCISLVGSHLWWESTGRASTATLWMKSSYPRKL